MVHFKLNESAFYISDDIMENEPELNYKEKLIMFYLLYKFQNLTEILGTDYKAIKIQDLKQDGINISSRTLRKYLNNIMNAGYIKVKKLNHSLLGIKFTDEFISQLPDWLLKEYNI